MSRAYSLAYLTIAALSPVNAVKLAAKLGYQYVGTRLAPATPGGSFSPLIDDAALLRETLAAMADTGVEVFDVEIIRLGATSKTEDFARFLECSAALRARAILVAGDDPDEARLTDTYAAFCRAAAPYGLSADLEFMPWTKVPDCRTAMRIVEAAGQPNGGILVDALHMARSATSMADIVAIPCARLNYAQICDAPGELPTTVEGLTHTARSARLLPGEGGIDLVELFRRLPRDLPVSIEIPNDERVRQLGEEAWARAALAATKAVLAAVDAAPA
jgi:sugar phosphate isomerase/epimerase